MIAVLFAIVVVIGSIYFFFLRPDPLSHVPGPRRVPIFGTSLHLDPGHPHISIATMARRYGPIFQLNYQGNPCVVACDFAGIHQVLVSKSGDFAGRPSFYLADVLSDGQSGIPRTDAGQEVLGRRKLVHKYLRQYGTGLQRIEQITTDATQNMIQEFLQLNGEAVDISLKLEHCVLNIITIITIGERVGAANASKIQSVFRASVQALGTSVASEVVNTFPFMRYLPNPAYDGVMKANDLKHSLILKWIDSKPSNGLVSCINELSDAEKEKYEMSELKQQVQTVFDVLIAGSTTTTSTLSMLINVLCHRPDVQEKLRQESREVISSPRLPTLADRDQMPYHMATLLEINRYASVIPLGLPHKTVRDTSLESNGAAITIPAGTEVITHLWSMHHDEEYWSQPFQFDPDRFLDSSGRLVAADHPSRKHLMAFGAGRRVCLGEVFAMSRMFLILSHMTQRFRILPESTLDAQPSCDSRHVKYGSVSMPTKFKVRLIQW